MRHSGGDSLRCTSAMVTLYLEVEERRERRPGVEQKMSVGRMEVRLLCWFSLLLLLESLRPEEERMTGEKRLPTSSSI